MLGCLIFISGDFFQEGFLSYLLINIPRIAPRTHDFLRPSERPTNSNPPKPTSAREVGSGKGNGS